MLVCPKCQRTYEEGTQRFCVNDGARLNPQKTATVSNAGAGVFSGILNKSGVEEQKIEFKPLPPKLDKKPLIKSEPIKTEISKSESPRTFSKLIKPDEILSNQAKLGDRRVSPVGRVALSADNPNILLGQTVKGRYFIKSRISQTAHSIKYAATDKLNSDKKVIVRIYTGKLDGSDFSAKIFADERVSLSHINHPNVAKVFDSGELPEGNPFIVSDLVKGFSIKESLARKGKFEIGQTARLIRQAANGLSEAHQNGVLHRNLNSENLIQSVNEAGTEQIKVTDFNIFSDKTRGEFNYLAPEQIGGRSSNFSADIYSLAVIAFQMLTGTMPFNGLTSKDLFKSQQAGLLNLPKNLNVSGETENVLRKALSFAPTDRFQSVRDFGDAFYNSITSKVETISDAEIKDFNVSQKAFVADDFSVSLDSVLDETDDEIKIEAQPEISETIEIPETPDAETFDLTESEDETEPETVEEPVEPEIEKPVEPEIEKPFKAIKFQKAELGKKAVLPKKDEVADIPWERRSIEPPPQGGSRLTWFSILGIGTLFILSALIFYYFINRPAEQVFTSNPADNQPTETVENQLPTGNKQDINEIPPTAREIAQPPDTVFFENSKENLSSNLLKYYRNFTLFFPKDWKQNKLDKNRNKVDDKFIDISKTDADGIPIEQFMVSYYESDGTFELDQAKFPEIVGKASEDIKKSPLPNFQLVGSGAVSLNKTDGFNGWKAYEMKFQGEGTAMNGDKIKLFGRRFYIPPARATIKKGLVVTLLATSLSKDVQSADDLGTKGDLKTILSTFEPDQNY